MNKLFRLIMLATVAGAILAFNVYHADYKLLVAQVGTIVLASIWLIRRITDSREVCVAKGAQRLILLFLAVCAVSFLTSPQRLASWSELHKVGTWIIFGLLVGKAEAEPRLFGKSRGRTSAFLDVWLLCAGIVALYGILQFFGIDFMKLKLPGGRIVSTFGNATLLAGFLAMTIPVAIDTALKKAQDDKKVFVAMIALVMVLLSCLVLTKSRGGILAATAGIGILYILRAKSFRCGPAGLVVLLGAVTLAAVLLLIPQARYVIFEVILRKTARIYLWKDAIQMVRVSPLFGIGIGTFGLYFPDFVKAGVLEMHPIEWEFVNHVHCEYLETLIETGILGLLAFLAAAGSVIYRFTGKAKLADTDLGLFAGFTAILVHNIVSVDLRYTSTGLFFWMIAGIVTAGQAPQPQQNGQKRKGSLVVTALIIITALTAVYFTARPYVYIQKVKNQEFFVKDTAEINKKIASSTDYFSLGVLYAKKQDFKRAKRYFIETIKENPRHAGAFNNLGNISFMQNDADKARAFFHKAVTAEPDNVDYLVNFAYACFKVNLMDDAMKTVEKALVLAPENARARLLQRQMTQ